ncbi:MAG: tRNA nucleotidyltransferase, partial [Desulfobacterales bacterium]
LVVGGAVRDMLLGQSSHDVDLLTNARPDQIREIFANESCKIVGKQFPVCLVNGVEIAFCRASSGSDPWFLADLAMRDLTINAMGVDPVSQELIDPFGGRKDMEERRIRFVRDPHARIAEDPLRMIRACRFAAMIQGTIDEQSFQAIVNNAHVLVARIPGERIRLELLKAMSLDRGTNPTGTAQGHEP